MLSFGVEGPGLRLGTAAQGWCLGSVPGPGPWARSGSRAQGQIPGGAPGQLWSWGLGLATGARTWVQGSDLGPGWGSVLGQVQFQGSAPGSGFDCVGGSEIMFPWSRVRGCGHGVGAQVSGLGLAPGSRAGSAPGVGSSASGLWAGAWGWGSGSVPVMGSALGLRSRSRAQYLVQVWVWISSPGLGHGLKAKYRGQLSVQVFGLDLGSGLRVRSGVGPGVGTQGWGLGLDMCQLHGPGLIASSGVGTPESGVSSRVRGSELGLVVRANAWVQGPGRWQGSRSGAQGQNEDWGFRVGSGAPETGAEWGLQGLV